MEAPATPTDETARPTRALGREGSPPDRRPPGARQAPPRIAIQDLSAWVLRVGVISSVATMLAGLAIAFVRNPPTVDEMEGRGATVHYRASAIVHGTLHADGASIIELGVVMLVLTPIIRVGTSMILFAVEERDWLYAAITSIVLGMTLVSLLALR